MAIWVSDIKQVPVEKITNRAFTALFAVLLQGDESASYFPFFAPLFATKPKTPERPFFFEAQSSLQENPCHTWSSWGSFFLYFQISVMFYFLYCCARKLKTNSFSVGKITKCIQKTLCLYTIFMFWVGGKWVADVIGDFVHLVANEDCEDIWMQRKR